MTASPSTATGRGLLTAALLLLACATPAVAAPADSFPGNHLYLTVTKGDARSSDTRGTLLLCDPPQGHRQAAQACAELAAADGDIAAIPAKDVYCSTLYAPVSVHARGEWRGRPVQYAQTFSNACVLAARTGSVFALDG